jgi:hypothetical protein
MKPTVFALAAVLILPLAAQAQPAQPRATTAAPARGMPGPAVNPTTPTGLTSIIQTAEQTQNSDALLLAYGQAVTNPQLARAALSKLLADYYTLRNQAQTADQATQAVAEATLRFLVFQSAQNQVIVQQNQQLLQQQQQIIDLLQRQARARQ